MEAANPDYHWRAKSWRYRDKNEVQIKEIKVKKMLRIAQTQPIFAIFPIPVNSRRIASALQATCTEEEVKLPMEYRDYADVFSESEADKLPESSRVAHSIEIEEGKEVPFGPIYTLSAKELRVLREYLESSMAKGWIRKSKSPAGAPILFSPKKDRTLRLCVDYRGLNKITIKNRYPLPLIGETIDRLSGAVRFTKLDLRHVYHRIKIKEGDE